MPFFPEFLYQLSPRDQRVTWLDPLNRRIETTLAGVDVTANFEVPDGQILLLQAAVATTSPGGAQTSVSLVIGTRITDQISVQEMPLIAVNIVAATQIAINFSGSLVVPPTWVVTAWGNFSAGVAANVVRLHLYGMLVPVGNVQRI